MVNRISRVTSEAIYKVLKKVENGKAPGTDVIAGFWYKNLMFYKADHVYIFQDTLKGQANHSYIFVHSHSLAP